MAQKAIREYYGKQLLYTYLQEFLSPEGLAILQTLSSGYPGKVLTAQDLSKNTTVKLPAFKDGFVAKPDELFGKRGKNNLVFVGKTPKEMLDWIRSIAGKSVTIEQNGKVTTGTLNNFLVEPYIPHDREYYLAIKTERDLDKIFFSATGGVEIEENWDQVTEFNIPFQLENLPIENQIQQKIAKLIPEKQLSKQIISFISATYQVFKLLNFSYLEINPFVFKDGELYMLDLVARLDDTALYINQELWSRAGKVEFPAPFGSSFSEPELKIMELDSKTGASLKFKVLNPQGSIWLLTSGGGGSVIFADTVGDLGYHSEIANYSDYSGNPNTEETREFCENVFSEMLAGKAKHKVLIIGGGIANFTDVAKTFTGVVEAIKKYSKEFKKQNITVYVRRGGPNYKQGLEYMKNLGEQTGIPIEVFGPEMYMTEVVKLALKSRL